MLDHTTKDTIVEVLKKYPVKLAYLYGSYAKGTQKSDSDIDIAVVPEVGVAIDEVRLAADIGRAVEGKEVDTRMIGLGRSPLLAFNAVRMETPIYVKNEQDRIRFEQQLLRRYFLDVDHLYRIRQHYRDKAFVAAS